VTLQFGNLGHSRGSNEPNVNHAFNDQGGAFFSHYLKGAGAPPAPGSVTAYTQSCSGTSPAPDGGPYTAASYQTLSTGTVKFSSNPPQTVTANGDPNASSQFDPIANSNACKTISAETAPGTAVYTYSSRGFTMLGLPTVKATIAASGNYGELDSQLFDVMPNGTERLVTRGAYRLTDNQAGQIVFQLHGNGYYFAAGDQVKLVLLGSDAPYLRKSNDGSFTVRVSKVTVSLPTR
jgi:predicted acyl esterase